MTQQHGNLAPRPEHPGPGMASEPLETVLARHRTWLETDGATGARADLAGADLRGRALWRADLRGADLAGADLRGANLDHARLGGASLGQARLAGASLWEADLSEADLVGADLKGAKLDHALLRAADLRRADLAGALLWGAHLEGADLRDAVGLLPAQVEPAFRDAATRLPWSGSADPVPEEPAADDAASPSDPKPGIRVGQIYRDAKQPRRHWRVTDRHDDLYRLERVDSPNLVRYPNAAALADENRYLRHD